MSQPSPSGATSSAADGRLSRKIDSGCHRRRAVSSGMPSRADKAARSAGPLACSVGATVWL
eukprot:5842401-Alexandrium_andersonii.AAC.1